MDQKIIKKLEKRLSKELPGWAAHQLMATDLHRKMRLQPRADAKRAGVLVLFFTDHTGLKLPFILRATYKGVHSGQIGFPGGKFEETDASIVDTALRETWEEIGVKVSPEQVLGCLSNIYIPPSNLLVTPIVAYMDHQPAYLLDPHEVKDIIEIEVEDLLNSLNHSSEKITTYEGHEFEVPCYRIENHIIWGATAMMISELTCLLDEIIPAAKASLSK